MSDPRDCQTCGASAHEKCNCSKIKSNNFSKSVFVKYINRTNDEDGFGAEMKFCSGLVDDKGNYLDHFACEYDNVGFDTVDHWIEDLKKIRSGFYILKYNYYMESESWEYPHIQYPVFEDFVMEVSIASAVRYYKEKIKGIVYESLHKLERMERCFRILWDKNFREK